MFLESIKIQAFRSLYDVTFQPGQFTVLAGPNNAGKSTLAQALHFLGETHLLGLEYAISRNGGYENVAHRRVRRTKQPVAFEVDARLRYREVSTLRREVMTNRMPTEEFRARYGVSRREFDPELRVTHSFSFKALGEAIESDFSVLDESAKVQYLEADGSEYQTAFRLHRGPDDIAVESQFAKLGEDPIWRRLVSPLSRDEFLRFYGDTASPTGLVATTLGFNPVLRHFGQALGSVQLLQLNPLECRLPGSPTPNAELGQHGSNLPALVAHMMRTSPEAWSRTLDAMRSILPGLLDIRTTFTPDRRLAVQFVEKGGGRPWTSEEVSDGTIQSLALFLALYDTRRRLIVIEEPENSLHPWIVRAFVDACRDARNKQIILTTHSPALLTYLRPEEVTLIWRREGRTQVRPLVEIDPEAERLWSEGAVNVFDILDGGFLRESVPEGFV